ncbi:leucyl aminopeptidase [Sphingomicrobium lutaoense]|uniref:Probable cytosol aminopeptidase n=1 Tax=Sphingomicrobium lutaoense TaxID=515949 RepID=A0A839Z1L6_9SPHN|nr:leucyl aminopeptidase [Sphingomicrobium lutaoense]MBB3763613.1 leucyl aminopeptidase [Sphingomicrobium lutaoense]
MQIRFADNRPAGDFALVIPAAGQGDDRLESLGSDLDMVKAAMRRQRFEGKAKNVATAWLAGDNGRRLLVIGEGDGDGLAAETLGATVSAQLLTSGETHAVVDLKGSEFDAEAAARLALGATLRAWRYDRYRTKLKDEQKVTLVSLTIVGAPDGAEARWKNHYQEVAAGCALTRELVTEPANVIYPESFVERVKQHNEGTGLEISVLDEKEMEELGMGALLGVAQGSVRKPRLLIMKWMGGKNGEKPTVLIGKGVTFDTGGISLKPPLGMESMKWDMGGAGAVSGAMRAIAGRKAKANVIGICGLVENMPDGNAQRPGDVVTTMSGQTVEVINTDAEGRLVLCDAMTYAQKEFSPERMIDLATLTGAMVISLGHEHAGIFSNDDDLAEDLIEAGKESGDKLWRQPLGEAYDRLIDSPIADMKNVGPREAGSITAAQYLQRFVEDGVKWAHLDIAGMAWSDKAKTTFDKGATGYGVRLLDRFVEEELEG